MNTEGWLHIFNQPSVLLQIKDTYDLVQNLKTVTESNNGNVTSYDYDGMRRVTRQSYPNGWVAENEYDSMGRVVKIWDIDPSQKDLKTIKHTYSYDAYGNLLSEYKRGNGQGQAKEDWAYQYDELNRLVQAHETHGQYLRNYQYDSLGNLTYEWNDNNVVIDYKLNNLNQITTRCEDNMIADGQYRSVYGYCIKENCYYKVTPYDSSFLLSLHQAQHRCNCHHNQCYN